MAVNFLFSLAGFIKFNLYSLIAEYGLVCKAEPALISTLASVR